jgi:LCP family protein required for cell wall assembly
VLLFEEIAVVKQVERPHNRLIPEVAAQEARRKLEDARQNLFFILHRLSFIFPQNRLLLRILAFTLFVMLGASLALLTPIWRHRAGLNQGQLFSLGNANQNRDLWGNSSDYQLSRPINILVMGIGSVPGVSDFSPEVFTGSSDTMLLLQLNPKHKSITVLSIPRDSQVVIPGIGLAKISLANSRGGSALAARVVSRTLNNVPIDRYVRITPAALGELVDLLGGVEVFVPQRMSYKDTTEHLATDLDPGWQTLDGEQAQQFARFRDGASGDIARVQRQQALLKALRDRLTSPTVLPNLPQFSRIMLKYVDTNLSLEEILALVNFGVEVEQQNFQMVLLPGALSRLSKNPSSYWLDSAGKDRVMDEYFGVKSIGVAQKTSSPNTLKIAIQNASGQPNLSQRVVKYLKQQGFANVYIVSDWPDLQRQTQIIVQKGDLEGAAALHKVLGLGNVEAASTGALTSDLTIRVGKDWNN